MANVRVQRESLEDIADAIRSKTGVETTYKPSEMADAIAAISGGGGITPTGTKTINITQNGTVTEDVANYANAQVNVNVPSVSPTGTKQVSVTQNGTTTEDVTNYASAEIAVNVPNSYSASDEGKVVSNGALVAQTSRSVTANGTIDTTLNSEVNVNVPNSYTSADEGKVVSSGALVAQSSQTITDNGTYDTTLKNEVVVNIGVRKAEGTFTLTADGNPPTLTHNLGTQKIALVIYPTTDVVAHSGYKNWIYELVNYCAIIGEQTFNLDYTPYNSTRFPDVVSVASTNGSFKIANGQASPWTSQTAWNQGTVQAVNKSNVTFTDDTVKVNGSFCSATYKWIVYALE